MARAFSGTGQYLSCPDTAALQVPFPLAIGFWFNGSAQGAFKYLLSKVATAGDHPSYGFSTDNVGALRFLIAYGTAAGQFVASPTVAAATVFSGAWHHVLGTYNGASIELYVDGVRAGTGTAETRAIGYAALPLYVGSFDGTQLYAAGSAAELAIWSSVPSAGEIVALAAGFAPAVARPTDLVAYWPLIGGFSPEIDVRAAIGLTVTGATAAPHCRIVQRARPLWVAPDTTGGATSITLIDTGAAADSLAVTVAAALTDTAAGADAAVLAVAATVTDSAASGDAIATTVTAAVSDAGSAADALAAGVPIAVTDTGAAGDLLALTVTVPLADAAAASAALAVGASAGIADAASGADQLAVLAALALVEAGSALDALSVARATGLSDVGSADDAVNVVQQSSSAIALAEVAAARERFHVLCLRASAGATTRPDAGATTRPDAGITYYQ